MKLKYSTTFLYTMVNKKKTRSTHQKRKFLRLNNLKHVPNGYQVDHIIPLHLGGSDSPDNMQLITIEQHKEKTMREMQSFKRR